MNNETIITPAKNLENDSNTSTIFDIELEFDFAMCHGSYYLC